MRARLTLALVALLIFAGAASAAPRADTAPAQLIAALNLERAENGIPAGIVENAAWSHNCSLHNHYMALNDQTHFEDATKPGYTDDGAWAGQRAVLSPGGAWEGDVTPWEYAPIHLAQILAPGLASMGAAASEGYSCATTWPGYTRVGSTDTLYTYPGNGRTNFYSREIARELPFTPGTLVGIPEGTLTGPYLYVFSDGPWSSAPAPALLASASLTGPNGNVEIKTIDQSNSTIRYYLPSGTAMIIPVKPLAPGSPYTATATMRAKYGETQTTSWRFTTALLDNHGLLIAIPALDHLAIRYRSDASPVTITVFVNNKQVMLRRLQAPFGFSRLHLKRPRKSQLRVCLQSGGGDTGYEPFSTCQSFPRAA